VCIFGDMHREFVQFLYTLLLLYWFVKSAKVRCLIVTKKRNYDYTGKEVGGWVGGWCGGCERMLPMTKLSS
jgi:hypothetical protein